MEIKLGMTVEDKITGFQGIVTGHVAYITGCAQYLVQPKCKDGESQTFRDAHWIDEARLVIRGDVPIVRILELVDRGRAFTAMDGTGPDLPAPIR